MEQLTESTTPRREPESITRLRQITNRRTKVNVDTVEGWLDALTYEPWRGPADIAANPPASEGRRYRREEIFAERAAALRKAKKLAEGGPQVETVTLPFAEDELLGTETQTAAGSKLTAEESARIRAEIDAELPELIAVSEAQLLADLADLGHFVFVSGNGDRDVEGVWADKLTRATYDDAIAGQVAIPGMAHAGGLVIVDPKYSRRLCGKDLLRAVMRAVAFVTGGEIERGDLTAAKYKALRTRRLKERRHLLQRWVLRRHWGLRSPLTYPVIATVAKIAAIGRIEELDEVAHIGGEPNPHTASLLVEAWDFLTVGVDDAVRAVRRICADAGGVDDLDSPELDRAVLRLRTLHEGIAARLERDLTDARKAKDARRWHAAAAGFARRVNDDPQRWNPGVGDLNAAQILRLVGTAGIPTTEPDHRIEAEVRGWIEKHELTSELSTSLLWHGVSFAAAGHGEKFQEALARRQAGDLGWADELNTISATAAHATSA